MLIVFFVSFIFFLFKINFNFKFLVEEASAADVHQENPHYFTCYIGPIFSNAEAGQKSNAWLDDNGLTGRYEFTGEWKTPKNDWNVDSLATFKRI